MKVKVRLRRWDADYITHGAAVRKPVPEPEVEAARWQHPPRYEVRELDRAEKVVSIREQPEVQMAEILPIRPAEVRAGKVEDLTPAELVQGLTHILNPASAFFLALGMWRLGADMGLTSEFALSEGPLSHWQVWIAAAGGLQAIGVALRKRFAADPDRPGVPD
jgi:hypothetical protein